jgi:GTP-binding protein
MTIKTAEFVASNVELARCPRDGRPEYAFTGRSNVGKSSLINMLTAKKGLAMTSSTPGKTQLMNYFIINNEWYIVDLPGYGYAKLGKDSRRKIRTIIDTYLCRRVELTCLFVLIDSRLEPQRIDLEFIGMLGESGIPFAIIFTKSDKISNGRLRENVEKYRLCLLESWEELPPMFCTSATHGKGRDEVLDYIEKINTTFFSKGPHKLP